MPTFTVVPSAYPGSFTVEAEEIAMNESPLETVSLLDKGKVVAVISLKNVAAVYRDE